MPLVAASQPRQWLEINGVDSIPQTAPKGIFKNLLSRKGLPALS